MFELDKDARDLGITPVENAFIRHYMPGAKGEYVKVYLWGLCEAMYGGKDCTADDAAAALDMQLNDVKSALRYWERRALVTLKSKDPEVYEWHSPLQRMTSGTYAPAADDAYTVFAESVYALFGEKRKIRPGEIVQAWEWVQDLGLSQEVVLMLLAHCMSTMRPQFSFKKAEALAVVLKENNITNATEADTFFKNDMNVHKGVADVLRILGKRGRLASEPEAEMYRKWIYDWHFTHEAILAACEETIKGEPSFAYLDAILNGLRERTEAREGEAVRRQIETENETNEQVREFMNVLGARQLSRSSASTLYAVWRKSFSHEVIMLAAAECAKSANKVENMEKLLDAWQQKGLTDADKVQAYLNEIHEQNETLLALFEKAGINARPSAADRGMLLKWRQTGFPEDVIMYAATLAYGAAGGKMTYLDKTLSAWDKKGIRDLTAAMRDHAAPAAGRTRTVAAQQYTQREYSQGEMEEMTAGAAQKLAQEAKRYE